MDSETCPHEKVVIGRDYRCVDFKFVYVCCQCGELFDLENDSEVILMANSED